MTVWEKTKHSSKASFDAAWNSFGKIGAPVNKLTNRIGSEASWPTSLDKESDKAARILKSFCKEGFYADNINPALTSGPKQPAKVLVKIPPSVIRHCVGLAIFSTMRTGLWVSGSGGSGVLIARLPDGTWSPPSGILVHMLGVGFNAGIDIYDCIVVINSPEALTAFSRLRVTLGGEISVAAGPVGVDGTVDSNVDLRKKTDRTPVLTYMKSRGLYAGVQIDGTFIVERNDENARFYSERVPAREILAGRVTNVPAGTRWLMEVAKSAEGRNVVDQQFVREPVSQTGPEHIEAETTTDDKNVTFEEAEAEKDLDVDKKAKSKDADIKGFGAERYM